MKMDKEESVEKDRPMKVRIEHLSFEVNGKYMDVEEYIEYTEKL